MLATLQMRMIRSAGTWFVTESNLVVQAQEAAYKGVKTIVWDDAYYRNDIGWRAVDRLAA